ncbi:MAG: TetR/AcrR family transcriptional regulator [Bacteroidota bacterium]
MPATKTTPEAILRQAWIVFHRQGYHHTSLQQLADAAGLGKAGILHHFKSKAGVMRAVLDFAADWYQRKVLAKARGSGSVAERLEAVLRKQFTLVQYNENGGCFFGNTILETGVEGPFTEELQRFYRDWTEAITTLLSEQFPTTEARERAYRIFTDYQGSVVLFKLYQDTSHLERLIERSLTSLTIPISPHTK